MENKQCESNAICCLEELGQVMPRICSEESHEPQSVASKFNRKMITNANTSFYFLYTAVYHVQRHNLKKKKKNEENVFLVSRFSCKLMGIARLGQIYVNKVSIDNRRKLRSFFSEAM